MTEPLVRAVEAVLFASEQPLTVAMIEAHVGEGDIRAALRTIEEACTGRGFELIRRGDHWHFQTAPDLAHLLRRDRDEPRRLSRAAIGHGPPRVWGEDDDAAGCCRETFTG